MDEEILGSFKANETLSKMPEPRVTIYFKYAPDTLTTGV
ncbi:hypothetical protein SVI_1802 [Shewanella violacea DSS12]|uniref:Uncharacterized protein n=1 Tax=Shewanella violacea (strain JCM 10179 / CIP 106290 / LMG 19151 / DSS12) TaxID=637905 RepID=D4ZJC4_SHEVD|nr:hypothetical protein SVI_1802 [Shewanella violacea DSS12]